MASLVCVHIFTGNLHSEWTKIWPGEKNGIMGSRFFYKLKDIDGNNRK